MGKTFGWVTFLTFCKMSHPNSELITKKASWPCIINIRYVTWKVSSDPSLHNFLIVLIIWFTLILAERHGSIEASAAMRPAELECPSDNVISTTYRCQVEDRWTDCSRSTCCHGYTFVAGRCVPDDINPCSLNLCEQRCSVYFGRVVCTCFSGFRFNREKHTNQQPNSGSTPVKVCEDIDECQVNNGECDQVSKNF